MECQGHAKEHKIIMQYTRHVCWTALYTRVCHQRVQSPRVLSRVTQLFGQHEGYRQCAVATHPKPRRKGALQSANIASPFKAAPCPCCRNDVGIKLLHLYGVHVTEWVPVCSSAADSSSHMFYASATTTLLLHCWFDASLVLFIGSALVLTRPFCLPCCIGSSPPTLQLPAPLPSQNPQSLMVFQGLGLAAVAQALGCWWFLQLQLQLPQLPQFGAAPLWVAAGCRVWLCTHAQDEAIWKVVGSSWLLCCFG